MVLMYMSQVILGHVFKTHHKQICSPMVSKKVPPPFGLHL